jgi:hypothetical protein
LTSKYVYAIVITLLAVWVTSSLASLHDRVSKKEEQARQRKKGT